MLKLSEIKKDYSLGKGIETVHALKGISIEFRKNEFVSILGPSGCGKTTLLNIIGGLDKYSSGDLCINGISTKEFKDKDWDVYRNHKIGFIFQSYNLIPHQTILGNVELALTIGGLSKEERIEKAKKAIDRVGLEGLYNKRPNQLSGGQCQRVAIARALVNEPEILLADEPTGALDTKTSVQIMDLIREISNEKLVIMVTHNPELATQYSSRIVKLLDGKIIEDSNPYNDDSNEVRVKDNLSMQKAKMSFFTAFKLSLRNLLSKKGRTTMTSIAGSIGIIGVSTVLAISSGITGYVDNMQNDMLSGNPITIQEETMDLTKLMDMSSMGEKVEIIQEAGYVNINSMIEILIKRSEQSENIMVSNDITQEYIDYVTSMEQSDYSAIKLGYGLDVSNNIYTDFKVNPVGSSESMSLSAITQMYTSVLKETNYADFASYITSLSSLFSQSLDNDDYLLSQYVVNGKIAKEKNEIMLVLDENSAITDLVLAQLGYFSQDEFINTAYKISNDSSYDPTLDKNRFDYEEILGKKFTWYNNNSIFNKSTGILAKYNPFTYNAYEDDITKGAGLELEIVGILQPKENISYGSLKNGFYYTPALTQYALVENANSEIVEYFKSNDEKDIYSTYYTDKETGMSFDSGITYKYHYMFNEEDHTNITGYVGKTSSISAMLGVMMGNSDSSTSNVAILTMRNVAGNKLANAISIYPTNFETKTNVLSYLDAWNNEGDITVNNQTYTKDQRAKITYSDNLSLVIAMIKSMINIITYALIAFTALSLLVSCVMIGIITYVSVVERTKEIGVIRSLGGRKKDVSNLFNAETFIIGLTSGLIGIGFTYLLSALINLIVYNLANVYPIANLSATQAITMILISIFLTLISGLIPSRAAAKRDPVVALRSE